MEIYAQFWRDIRLQKSMTQKQWAEILGLKSAQYISNVENCKCKYTLGQTRKLIEVLNLNARVVVNFLVTMEEDEIRKAFKKNLWV